MEDGKSNVEFSKKRAAGVQLSRDNPGLDDDDDEETLEQESGTFKRASDEVLATRRIVKVRRQQTSSTLNAPKASSASNPFASICLVPPSSTAPQGASADGTGEAEIAEAKDRSQDEESNAESAIGTDRAEVNDGNAKQLEIIEDGLEIKQNSQKDEADNVINPQGLSSVDGTVVDNSKDQAEKHAEEEDEDDKKVKDASYATSNEETPTFSSFGQLSSNHNAFSGLSGTGFASSTFSFGSLSSERPSGVLSFGTPNNGNSSTFGTGLNVPSMSEGSKISPLQEVPVKTGEENEKASFTADSVLFEFIDGTWKERGKGELRVNISTAGTGKARLVMRSKGNFRLILNASIFPDMKLTSMDKRGITFACVNIAVEGKSGLSTCALKFKDASIVDSFRAAVTEHISKTNPALKTPENSPKASEE
ncbi:hypothetical protein M569_11965 [Genlisea aurea]|uniref:RanBD1 domain-containing protein n=1 Tax=Genlisea aurea TaxID=192259 RepID=S8DIZ4_9LAMI|nr:hypothetical protein M569_11965 [Genlisea aurea]